MNIAATLLIFLVLAMLTLAFQAKASGWRELARHYGAPDGRERAEGETFRASMFSLAGGMLPFSYGRCVVTVISPAGLHLRTWPIYRFRHPPLLVPWAEIVRCEPSQWLRWRTMTLHVRASGVRIQLHGDVGQAVEQAWRRMADHPGRTAGG